MCHSNCCNPHVPSQQQRPRRPRPPPQPQPPITLKRTLPTLTLQLLPIISWPLLGAADGNYGSPSARFGRRCTACCTPKHRYSGIQNSAPPALRRAGQIHCRTVGGGGCFLTGAAAGLCTAALLCLMVCSMAELTTENNTCSCSPPAGAAEVCISAPAGSV